MIKLFVESIAKALFESKEKKGSRKLIINLWTILGLRVVLRQKGIEVVQQYSSLKNYLDKELKDEEEKAIVPFSFLSRI